MSELFQNMVHICTKFCWISNEKAEGGHVAFALWTAIYQDHHQQTFHLRSTFHKQWLRHFFKIAQIWLHTGRPLGQRVDMLKANICTGEYIQFGDLSFKNHYSKLQVLQGANSELTFQHTEQRLFLKSCIEWIRTF